MYMTALSCFLTYFHFAGKVFLSLNKEKQTIKAAFLSYADFESKEHITDRFL